jgi:hypothetical protein
MKTHLSQSTGAGAFDGQQGISLAISSIVADISSAIVCVEAWEDPPAMTGEDSGANTSPAIMTIASRRRMVIWQFTPQNPTERLRLIVCRG